MNRPISILLLILALTPWLAACSSGTGQSKAQLAPLSILPPEIRGAPVRVREAYQFAAANVGTLDKIPCYCGCDVDGHRSVRDCFVQQVQSDGKITWDSMGLG